MKLNYTGELMHAGGSFLRRFCHDETGAVLVETAIILPLMITLSAGVYEFSNAIYTRLMLESGVADAARYMSRCVHDDGDATEVANCETSAKNLAVCGTVGSGADLADCTSGGMSSPVRMKPWRSR